MENNTGASRPYGHMAQLGSPFSLLYGRWSLAASKQM